MSTLRTSWLPFPTREPERRVRALGLLLTFVLALFAGVFLHPLGDVAHECGVTQGHLDVPADHDHDEQACAFCNLTNDLGQSLATAPDVDLPQPALADRVAPATAVRAERRPLLGYCTRGPPLA